MDRSVEHRGTHYPQSLHNIGRSGVKIFVDNFDKTVSEEITATQLDVVSYMLSVQLT
jgi:hypothetical protein